MLINFLYDSVMYKQVHSPYIQQQITQLVDQVIQAYRQKSSGTASYSSAASEAAAGYQKRHNDVHTNDLTTAYTNSKSALRLP